MSDCGDINSELKRHRIFVKWVATMVDYFHRESLPRPPLNYIRGQVIGVDFGFNVGTEFGGYHYAIVLKDSASANSQVLVLPLTSKKPKRIFTEHIHVGLINGLRKDHWSNVYNIRSVDKLRISGTIYRINGSVLDVINMTIVKLLT